MAAVLLLFGIVVARAAAVSDARLELRTDGPTRVYLTDPAGAPVTPAGVMAYHKGDEHHFIVPGGSRSICGRDAIVLPQSEGPSIGPSPSSSSCAPASAARSNCAPSSGST